MVSNKGGTSTEAGKGTTIAVSCLVVYMSFDKFLLAVESCDLSQADKSIIRVSSFPKVVFQ